MKIKKSFSMILSTVMVLSMAGCGKTLPSSDISSLLSSGESTSSGESAQELVPEEGASLLFRANSGELAFGQAVAEKFKEKYGVEVTVEEGTGLDDYQKIVLEGPSGTGPDVFMLSHDYAAEGQQAGLFLELDSKIANKLKDKVNPVAMKTVTLGEQVFGVPVSIETSVLFYNKQLVTGDPASSFEQLLEESESFNDSAENKFWFLDDIVSGGSAMYPMLSAYGWNLFGEDGTDENNPGFDTPEFVKGLEVLQAYHELMPINSANLIDSSLLLDQFIEGKAAYLLSGPWYISQIREAGIDFGITSLPTYDGKQEKPFAFVKNAHVSAYTKYPIAAQLFAEYLVSDESAALLYSTCSKITSLTDLSSVDGLSDDEVLLSIVDAFGNSTPMPSAKRISYYWTIAGNIGPSVFDGKLTPEEAAQQAMEQWNASVQSES